MEVEIFFWFCIAHVVCAFHGVQDVEAVTQT